MLKYYCVRKLSYSLLKYDFHAWRLPIFLHVFRAKDLQTATSCARRFCQTAQTYLTRSITSFTVSTETDSEEQIVRTLSTFLYETPAGHWGEYGSVK